MRTVLNGPLPQEVDDLLARRRKLGQDNFDEVWHGEYHMNAVPNSRHGHTQFRLAEILGPLVRATGLHPVAEFNLGPKDNFRVPDLGVLRVPPTELWLDDAAIVIEVLSPHDESWQKFDHYAEFGVAEVWMVDPFENTVQIFERAHGDAEFSRTDQSSLLNTTASTIETRLRET